MHGQTGWDQPTTAMYTFWELCALFCFVFDQFLMPFKDISMAYCKFPCAIESTQKDTGK